MKQKSIIPSNREAYNKIADQWAESRAASSLSQLVVEFASHVKQGGKILDIGCGTGFPIAAYLSGQGFTLDGIDIAEKLLQKAIHRNLPNTRFFLSDFFEFEPGESYDGIMAFDSFFHFPKERQELIYHRVAGWMNDGAYLLFTHGIEDGEIVGEMFEEKFYYSALDKAAVLRLLVASGLEVVWTKEKYTERDLDRDFIVLARKSSK